jgi:succinate dehydrogenase/fumarate reductase cytochrome b subunit
MGMGLTVILLILLFHLMQAISLLLNNYNNLVDYINKKYNSTISYQEVIFFGEGMNSTNLLVDIIIVFVIIIIFLMVYLRIRWSVKK